MKAPKNKSLAWSILTSGSVAMFGLKLAQFMGIQAIDPLPLLRFGGQMAFGAAGIYMAHDYISSLPWRRFKVACENTGLYIERDSGLRLPHLRRREKFPWGLRLWYKMPIGLSVSLFEERREQFEAALDAEVNFAFRGGLLRVDILPGTIPARADFEFPDPLPGELPFIVGQGREGLITADLTSCPHLLVAGQTGAGKSNFLHTLAACFLQILDRAILHIIDLKRVEFSYLKKHVNVRYTLTGAIETLEFLTAEMHRRMAFLDRAGYVSAREWRAENSGKELPYHVLIVDEFSQLCPVLAKEKADRESRTYAHKLLVDLICLARSLGIHIVIATQRPDADILPGQLKANIPATICFKVRSEVNSRICLDNNRASLLPSPAELPGRAVWQHETEREVQTLFLPLAAARAGLKFTKTLPLPSSFSPAAGRFKLAE